MTRVHRGSWKEIHRCMIWNPGQGVQILRWYITCKYTACRGRNEGRCLQQNDLRRVRFLIKGCSWGKYSVTREPKGISDSFVWAWNLKRQVAFDRRQLTTHHVRHVLPIKYFSCTESRLWCLAENGYRGWMFFLSVLLWAANRHVTRHSQYTCNATLHGMVGDHKLQNDVIFTAKIYCYFHCRNLARSRRSERGVKRGTRTGEGQSSGR